LQDEVEYKETLEQPLRNSTLLFLTQKESILLAIKNVDLGLEDGTALVGNKRKEK
jgi:hypothetical protein